MTSRLGRIAAGFLFILLFPAIADAQSVHRVSDSGSLKARLENAKPGDRIVIAPGTYTLAKIRIRRGGAPGRPVIVTAEDPSNTQLNARGIEAIKLAAPHWRFENLNIVGNAATFHAFHLVADADDVVIRNSQLRNFHAAIKSNPERGKSPDRVLIENNAIFNDTPRQTDEPVTPIDVVGGNAWVVHRNFIADFEKARGNRISYGAFLKGGSTNGLFEANTVVCEWKHNGGIRIGLSFGGGSTSGAYRTKQGTEHEGGIMRNNMILNCPASNGIYLNNAGGSKIYNNTIFDAYGIVARFQTRPSEIRNNIISGAITARDGATVREGINLTFGQSFGAYIPGGARMLKRRISDYHIKFPSVFDKDNIAWFQRRIDGAARIAGRSFLGRGTSSVTRLFNNPRQGDFMVNDKDSVIRRGETLPDVELDFCGRRRLPGPGDLGAISYTLGYCDPLARSEVGAGTDR